MRIALLALILSSAQRASADINWPVYSQQCADDAGPPYADDEPGTYYHTGSAAYPVLNDRECAEPLKDACAQRPDFKTAYLEGPISCGNNGWYCRIFDDSANGWPTANLIPDLNFGQCNSVDSFEDAGYDRDGHCHGSSDDSTYYWWIRDHWFRGYNGKVRCCCGWYEGGSQPLYGGRIANRCDYRRLVVDEQDASNCRDANEDHGLGFDDIGCNQQYRDQIGSPIPEDDSVCWEIERFGFTEETYGIPTLEPTRTRKPTTPPVVTPDTDAPTDSSSPTFLRATREPTTSKPTKRPVSAPETKSPVTASPTPEEVTPSPTNEEEPEEDDYYYGGESEDGDSYDEEESEEGGSYDEEEPEESYDDEEEPEESYDDEEEPEESYDEEEEPEESYDEEEESEESYDEEESEESYDESPSSDEEHEEGDHYHYEEDGDIFE